MLTQGGGGHLDPDLDPNPPPEPEPNWEHDPEPDPESDPEADPEPDPHSPDGVDTQGWWGLFFRFWLPPPLTVDCRGVSDVLSDLTSAARLKASWMESNLPIGLVQGLNFGHKLGFRPAQMVSWSMIMWCSLSKLDSLPYR